MNLGFITAAQKGGRMSERGILKTLIVYLLIGCFLASNVMCVYASSETSTNSDSNENETKSPEYTETENPEYVDTEVSESSETGTPEYTQTEDTESTSEDSFEYTKADPQEYTQTEDSENTSTESPNYTETETLELETPESPQMNDTQTETSNDTQIETSNDTQTESSHHTKTSSTYRIKRAEYNQTGNSGNIQAESQNTSLPKSSKPEPSSASVSLHGEKTQVVSGEDILLRLSAVNLITKPPMHVQVIIIPPSGMSVSSSEFVQSGAGQYTTTYDLDPGQGRDIEVRIESNQPGNFNVKGRVIYYFGEDIKNAEDHTLDLPIQVTAVPDSLEKSLEKTIPGFGVSNVIFALISMFILKRNRI